MMDMKPRERWDAWMVQAQRFARRENYIDALGRVRRVLEEVQSAVDAETDAAELERLRRFAHRVEKRHQRIRDQFEAWNEKIRARRQAATDNAANEMACPMPIGPNEMIG